MIETRQFHAIGDEAFLKTFECPICLDVLKPKYCTCKKCGKNFCCECVNNIILVNDNAKCPLCKSIQLKDGTVTGGLDICSVIRGTCSECNLTMTRNNFVDIHLKYPCPVKCKFECSQLVSVSNQNHYDYCTFREENCPICDKLILSIRLSAHIVDNHIISMANIISKQESFIDSFESRMRIEIERMEKALSDAKSEYEKNVADYSKRIDSLAYENRRLTEEISLLGKQISIPSKTELNLSIQELTLSRTPLSEDVFYWNIGKSNQKLEYDRTINSVKRQGSISTHPSAISCYPIPNVAIFSALFGVVEFPNKQNAIAIGITTMESFIPSSSKVGRRAGSYCLSCDRDLGTEIYNGNYEACQKLGSKISEGNIIRMTLIRDDEAYLVFFISVVKQISKDGLVKDIEFTKSSDPSVWVNMRIKMLITEFDIKNEKLAKNIAKIEWNMNEIYIGCVPIYCQITSEYYSAITLASDSKLAFLGEEF